MIKKEIQKIGSDNLNRSSDHCTVYRNRNRKEGHRRTADDHYDHE